MLNKRELFNARNAGNKIEPGMVIKVVAVGIYDDVDKDDKPVKVSALKAEDGAIYTSISATVAQSIDDLDDIIADEGAVEIRVNQAKSNSGRDFYQLQIL